MPRLRRLKDGAGQNGAVVKAIKWNEDGTFKEVVGSVPVVGCSVMVESRAGMFTSQDYWLTTVVTEILEERKSEDGKFEYMKFKTGNSIYEITT